MKKAASLLLALIMMLSLAACGGAKAPEPTPEPTEDPKAAEERYRDELYSLANELLSINYACDDVTDTIKTIWNNVGGDEASQIVERMLLFNEEGKTAKDYAEKLCEAEGIKMDDSYGGFNTVEAYVNYVVWCVTKGLFPSMVGKINGVPFMGQFTSQSAIPQTISACENFTKNHNSIQMNLDTVVENVREFRTKYKDIHSDEVDTLNNFCIEIRTYSELALTPSGNLSSYQSAVDECKAAISRYTKVLDSYY